MALACTVVVVGWGIAAHQIRSLHARTIIYAGTPAEAERAVTGALDDYDIRMAIALRWFDDGRCDRAAPHLAAAVRLMPYTPAPHNFELICAARARALPSTFNRAHSWTNPRSHTLIRNPAPR
jgi:hypothetical protein